ncbi:GrpB family protein [Isoptericola sp. NPDC019693]|uniref:GrpB family protein n=1 Tax=Isoptericola sp. NPDC019693 TaxID=3364009 RepID=UPI0037AD36D0
MTDANPAALRPHDPRWLPRAAAWLDRIAGALGDLPGGGTAAFDHIGSTSVPGLAAKPYVDLQVRIDPLPGEEPLQERLRPLGLVRSHGSRRDSPGVYADLPRGGDSRVPADVWEKRLYIHPQQNLILHVRRTDSSWGLYTVWFRDWLREHASARARYETTKRRLSAQNAGKSDYDDYTLAKSAFFDEVEQEFVSWAKSRPR